METQTETTNNLTGTQATEVQKVFKGNPTLSPIFDAFLKHHSSTPVLTVDAMGETLGESIPRRVIVEWMHSLANAGLGRFWAGRRGKPSRFEWSINPSLLTPVIQAARESSGENPPPTENKKKRMVYKTKTLAAKEVSDTTVVPTFSAQLELRGKVLHIDIPSEITPEDVPIWTKRIGALLSAAASN